MCVLGAIDRSSSRLLIPLSVRAVPLSMGRQRAGTGPPFWSPVRNEKMNAGDLGGIKDVLRQNTILARGPYAYIPQGQGRPAVSTKSRELSRPLSVNPSMMNRHVPTTGPVAWKVTVWICRGMA